MTIVTVTFFISAYDFLLVEMYVFKLYIKQRDEFFFKLM